MRIVPALAFAMVCCIAHATKLRQLTIDELYSFADVVAVVGINSGSIVKSGEYLCGANYKVRVITPLKGELKEGQIIGFSQYRGYKIGSRYLAFLTTRKASFSPMYSTNSSDMNAEAERQKICGPVNEDYRVVSGGSGAFEVSRTTKFGSKKAVKLTGKLVKDLDDLEKKVVEPGDSELPFQSGGFWIRIEDIVGYISGLDGK